MTVCLAVPMQIKSIRGDEAEVESAGVTYRASLRLTPEAKVGDYVLLHTGYAISILDPVEARETLALFAQMDKAAECDQ
jgi:hydrogenase expression/formation protein HypC